MTVDVAALISKGGTAASNPDEPVPKTATPVLMRVPAPLLERIDHLLSARPVKIPRHTWILEAIVEKLEMEAS